MKHKKDNPLIRFNPSIDTGLTTNEVEHRIKNREINKLQNISDKTYFQIIIKNLFTFFNLMMFGIAALLFFFIGTNIIPNLTFLIIISLNILIGTIQECKSKKILKKLKLLSKGKITVLRNGEEIEINGEEIVLDDIIILNQGDEVPVDAIILSDNYCELNESLLTGESKPIKKGKFESIYAGSFVVSGRIVCRAEKIGEKTYIHSIEAKAKNFKKPKSQLLIAINSIINTLLKITIPLAFIALLNNSLSGSGVISDTNIGAGLQFLYQSNPELACRLANGILYGGTVIVYTIPIGMILLSSITMTTGVVNLSFKKVLAQDLYSVEALSRIDTLCLDKTGTITDGTMTVEKEIPLQAVDIFQIMPSYLAALPTQNQTSNALIKRYGKESILKPNFVIPFSSSRKYSLVTLNGDSYALGAPEYLTNDPEILGEISNYTKNGFTSLGYTEFL